MTERTGQWTEAERLEEIDREYLRYRKKKREVELGLREMRHIRKQIALLEDAMLIHTLRAPPRTKELLCA